MIFAKREIKPAVIEQPSCFEGRRRGGVLASGCSRQNCAESPPLHRSHIPISLVLLQTGGGKKHPQ
jgi:hypothetical protein